MDRRDRRQCAGLVRARTETGLVAAARGGRIPGLPSRDHALLRGCRGRGRGPDRSGWRPAAAVGPAGVGARTALALGRHVRHRARRESPVPRLAGILRFATVPALERAVVLRRLGRDRRSVLLGGAARGARLGRPAPLGTGARVPRHAPWRHDAGVVARPRPRRVVGTAGAGGVRGGRRGGLDPALVRSGGPAANAGASLVAKAQIRAAAAQRLGPDARWAALTIVGRPFRWEGLSASPDSVAGRGWAVARHLDHPAVRAALITSQGRAIAQFARFLAAAVDSSNGGIHVSLWDVRYHAPGSGADGWATVQVPLR